MKAIVVYYSLDGHTKIVAQEVAKQLSAQTFQLEPKNKVTDSKVGRYLTGGFQSLLKQKPPLQEMPDLSSYDTIVIGAPVWARRPASFVNTFLEASNLQGKKIWLFACAGDDATGALERMKKELSPGNEIMGTLEIRQSKPKEPGELAKEVEEWLGDRVLTRN